MPVKDFIGAKVHYCRYKNPNAFFSMPYQALEAPLNSLLFICRGKALFSNGKSHITGIKHDLFEWDSGSKVFGEARKAPDVDLSYFFLVFELLSSEGKPVVLSQFGFPPKVRPNQPGKIRRIFEEIHSVMQAKSDDYRLESSGLVLDLLKSLFAEAPSARRRIWKRETMDPRIEAALQHIEHHYKAPITAADLSKQACMHPVSFAALFKKHVGLPPHRYLLERKLEIAKTFLEVWNEGIVNTAEHLGFHDYSHFYRAFKRSTGMTPGQYAKQSKSSRFISK